MSSTPDFENDVRSEVLRTLPHVPEDRAALEVLSPTELLVLHANWRKRFVPPRQRSVHCSKAFLGNAIRQDPKYAPAIAHILDALENAGDLTPHLSERVRTGYVAKPGNDYGSTRDLDLLLNDWLVHHFHLCLVLRRDSLVKRTGPLLFAIVGNDDAYVVDVFPHGAWHREDVAHIVIDEWSGTTFVHCIPSIVGAPYVTEDDRKERRGAGINSGLIERNGRYYTLGFGGMSSAGTSVQDARRSNVLMIGLRNFAKVVAENPTWIKEVIRQNGIEPPQEPRLRFIIRSDGWYAIREENTHALFEIPGVPRDPV